MRYESVKYLNRPGPRMAPELREFLDAAALKNMAVIRFSHPMAVLLSELVDAGVLPERYHMRAARLLTKIRLDSRK